MEHSTKTSPSGSRTQRSKGLSEFSAKALASLQQYLDRDFQNYWDVRQFGAHLGLRIKCPACPWEPPAQRANEDFVWYGYRKWRALANHMVADHLKEKSLTYRHRVAVGERAKLAVVKKNKARAA